MIKKTFYNLSDKKKERIVNAIKKEFAENPSEKASINNIVKRADISRGSFYQYFDDKLDLIEVLYQDFTEKTLNNFLKLMMENNNDVFITFKKIFDEIVVKVNESEDKYILRNIKDTVKTNSNLFTEYMSTRIDKKHKEEFLKNINTKDFKKQNSEYIEIVFDMLSKILAIALFDLLKKEKEFEKIRKEYITKIDIIKNGAVTTPLYY